MATNDIELNDVFFNKIDNVMSIVRATGELFISCHLFDLKENKFIPIKSNEKINKLAEDYSTAQDKISSVMENLSVSDTLELIKKFTTLSTLPERLKDNRVISQSFNGKSLGWCNTMFVRLDNEEPLRYVLFIIQSVDKDIKRIEKMTKTAKENAKLHAIVNGLMAEYTTVCSVNLEDGSVEFLRTSDKSQRILQQGNFEPNYNKLISYYINYGIHDKDIESACNFFSLKNLKSIKSGSSQSLIYRNDSGEYGETKLIRTGRKFVLIGFAEKNKEIEQMKENIYTDSLTGVKNRKYYDEELKTQPCQGLVMADLDLFKNINDTYGHQIGDEALVAVANKLKSCVRKTDDIVRYGGDEFVLAFTEITEDALKSILEKMRKEIESTKIEEHPEINLSMSFGAVCGNSTVEDMISKADEALYASKEQRNAISVNNLSNEKGLKLVRP